MPALRSLMTDARPVKPTPDALARRRRAEPRADRRLLAGARGEHGDPTCRPTLMAPDFRLCRGYLADTGTAKGLGVFAACDLAEGDIVEVAPLVVLRTAVADLETALLDRVFSLARYDRDGVVCDGVVFLSLGYGSLYNHGNPANLRCGPSQDATVMMFVAARAVAAGEELTINYHPTTVGGVVSADDRWLAGRGITPVPPVQNAYTQATPRSRNASKAWISRSSSSLAAGVTGVLGHIVKSCMPRAFMRAMEERGTCP